MIKTSLLKKYLLGLIVSVIAGNVLAHPPATRSQPAQQTHSSPTPHTPVTK